jgi:hypothetical protein
MGIKGGVRPGAGRKKGVPNKKTAAQARAVAESGMTPLDFLLWVMRNDDAELGQRLDAGKAAAQYVHPKLQPVDGKSGSSEIRARVTVEFVARPST